MRASRVLLLPPLGAVVATWGLSAGTVVGVQTHEPTRTADVTAADVLLGPTLRGVERPCEERIARGAGEEQAITRTYTLPAALERGWAWSVSWEEQLPGGATRSVREIVAPEKVASRIVDIVFERGGAPGTGPTFFRESEERLVVTAREERLEVVTSFLERGRWEPCWIAWDLAAMEILAIEREGSPDERAWALDARARGGRALEGALAAQRERERIWGDAESDAPAAPGAVAVPAPSWRLRVRHLHHAGEILRELGFDARSLHVVQPDMRSGSGYVDDTQLEALERLRAGGSLTCLEPDATLDLAPGQAAELRLAGGLRLWVRRSSVPPHSGRNVVCFYVSLRGCATDGLVFVPAAAWALPLGGTLFLAPADTLLPDGPAAPGSHVLVSLEQP
jgi:hypothetical protein